LKFEIFKKGANAMDRRNFLAASCTAGLAAMTSTALGGSSNPSPEELLKQSLLDSLATQMGGRDYYELRKYLLDTEEQKSRMDVYLRDAAIPAYNRLGVNPVGVFYLNSGEFSPIYVLLRYNSLYAFATATSRLLADSEFQKKGADVLDTPSARPAYKRIETQLMVAFTKMPKLETPTKAQTRIFQLRKYENHSIKAQQRKIEMFNSGEIDIFRKTGMNPVFFGESLIDSVMPNLTYMLGFDDMDQSRAAWSAFMRDPDWKIISSIPENSDRQIVSNITNIYLKPALYSQI
jgi:hypothetical protein